MPRNNPYKAKSASERKKENDARIEINKNLKHLSELGQKCLNHPDFTKYHDELVVQKDEIIKLMVQTVNPDPVQDAYFLRACLNKLSVYFEILELPKDDAGRKVIDGKA